MKSFFKYFFSAFLALIVFFGLLFIIFSGVVGMLMSSEKVTIPRNSVLVLDLSRSFNDRQMENPILDLTGRVEDKVPTLSRLIRMIHAAERDSAIRGIYVVARDNNNGFASSEEIRNALIDFKHSGKFIVAFGDYLDQKGYYVASVADQVYCHPKGMLDWRGFSVEYMFFKKTLDKLEIKPQIFYDGKFKSATEPFREEKMTDANRLQTNTWIGDIYGQFLSGVSQSRKVDTGELHRLANDFVLRDAEAATKNKLLDGGKYDDEVKAVIKSKLKLADEDKISFITPGSYLESGALSKTYNSNRIAVVYAEGEIVYGTGVEGQIGSDEYLALLRKIRYTKDIKSVVLRINSPGGSSLASEIIWREIELIKKSGKPVVVSMGDVAASGGYYIACNADSIFAQPNTITGSIGVFAMVPDFSSFMKNKLGVTFDGVKTATYADAMTVTRPLTPNEKAIIQKEVDIIYSDFKTRVAEGRKKDTTYIDSIAQGRVWTGQRALGLGLVDRMGSLEDAIACAARLAKISTYSLREYPEPVSPFDAIFRNMGKQYKADIIKEEIGEEEFKVLSQIKKIKQQAGEPLARMAFDFTIR